MTAGISFLNIINDMQVYIIISARNNKLCVEIVSHLHLSSCTVHLPWSVSGERKEEEEKEEKQGECSSVFLLYLRSTFPSQAPQPCSFFHLPKQHYFLFFLVSALICCGLKISARTNLIFSIIFSNDFPCIFAGKRKRISLLGCVSELFLMDLFSQAPAAFAFGFDYDDDYDNDIMNCNEFFLVSGCK